LTWKGGEVQALGWKSFALRKRDVDVLLLGVLLRHPLGHVCQSGQGVAVSFAHVHGSRNKVTTDLLQLLCSFFGKSVHGSRLVELLLGSPFFVSLFNLFQQGANNVLVEHLLASLFVVGFSELSLKGLFVFDSAG
jgi:hypothetical protein